MANLPTVPGTLAPLPKFQGPSAPGPQNIADWVSFMRWLIGLWRKAQAAIDAPQSIAIALPSSAGSAQQSQETLGAAGVFQAGRPLPSALSGEETLAAGLVMQRPANVRQPETDTAAIQAFGRPHYPAPPWAQEDTHANRLALYPAASFPDGARFFETDRTVTYVAVAGVWTYAAGEMAAAIASLPSLGAADAGFRFLATDYRHTFRWTGSAWEFAPGDAGSGFFQDFAIAPGAEWQICDGSATTYAKADGTTAAFTTPNLTTGAYRKGAAAGGYTGTVNAAGTVTLAGITGDTSGGTPAGTVTAPTLTMDSYTPAGTVTAPTFTGSALATHQHTLPINISGTAFAFSANPYGSGATVTASGIATGIASAITFAGALSEAVSAGTPAGTNSVPTFTGTPAVLTGTNSVPSFTGAALAVHHHDLSGATATFTGDPVRNIAVPTYFRR